MNHIHPGDLEVRIRETNFILLSQRALYWPGKQILLLSDLHWGKSGHFRKHGIAISSAVLNKDMEILAELVSKYPTERLIIIGDLFHSYYNNEWKTAASFFNSLPCNIELVQGNHDILDLSRYSECGIKLHQGSLEIDQFTLVHEPIAEEDKSDKQQYFISGHIHPGISLIGNGRQKLNLPCFFLSNKQMILPAFGRFTGLYLIQPKVGDRIYAIADQQVIGL